jgi:hypothetical protein
MSTRKLPNNETLRKLYVDDLLSTTQIGKLYNVSHKNVSVALKKAGIETRKVFHGLSHPSWKGGRIEKAGYIVLWMPQHHRADAKGYVKEHIIVAEQKIGRELRDNEVVHHINRNKKDNRPENLAVMTRSQHSKLHNPKGLCKVCGAPEQSHGLCQKHLARFKKYGNPLLSKHDRYSNPTVMP